MKSITLSMLLLLAVLTVSPSAAGSGDENATEPSSGWSRFWQGVRDDWKKIGSDAKESGTEAGRTVTKEIQEMPDNFRKGFKAAQEDFKNGTGASKEPRTED